MEETKTAFERLINIMDELREKCPWDRKQTFESLRKLTIEETYELTDAILQENLPEIKEELGDILLHIVFYAKLAEEQEAFTLKQVLNSICDKLVYRHPHVFSSTQVADSEEVKKNWEDLKRKDNKKSVLQGIPKSLPAVVKADRIQEKVAATGFDWDYKEQVWDKIKEEIQELGTEITNEAQDKIEEEFGDMFFSLINAARLYNIDPEAALERTNQKFIQRFQYLEQTTNQQGKSLQDMDLTEMEAIWQEAKKHNKS